MNISDYNSSAISALAIFFDILFIIVFIYVLKDISPKNKARDFLNDVPLNHYMERLCRDSNTNFIYYKDIVTDVMYLWRFGCTDGGLTVMLDPEKDGAPLTYARFVELYKKGISK